MPKQETFPGMIEQIVIRDPRGKPDVAKLVDWVEIEKTRFALTKYQQLYTITEPLTGFQIGLSTERAGAIQKAQATLQERGMDAFHKAVDEKLNEYGKLPTVEELQKTRKV